MSGRDPFDCPVLVEATFCFDKANPYTHVMVTPLDDVDIDPYVGTGDIDNYEKTLFDAGNGILYRDDRQICLTVARKIK